MPQSLHDHAAELHNIPEHAAEAAATSHNKAPQLTAHEETVQAEEHSRDATQASKLVHGHAASVESKK
jgi:hypothetical protein